MVVGREDLNNLAQNMTTPLGKMIRINVSGGPPYTIPADNPFANADPADTLRSIWANGLRNPYRFSFDRLTGDVWIGDVGQGAQEEVDFVPAGVNNGPNFGWRCYEGTAAYNTTGCQPMANYVNPSTNTCIPMVPVRSSVASSLSGRFVSLALRQIHLHGLLPWTHPRPSTERIGGLDTKYLDGERQLRSVRVR